jgi:hypothetical protein
MAVRGTGQIWHEGSYLCIVEYQLDLDEEQPSFTATDGIIQVQSEEGAQADEVDYLEPGEELRLQLEEPLADGRQELALVVEAYEGHRPHGRYQVRVEQQ